MKKELARKYDAVIYAVQTMVGVAKWRTLYDELFESRKDARDYIKYLRTTDRQILGTGHTIRYRVARYELHQNQPTKGAK